MVMIFVFDLSLVHGLRGASSRSLKSKVVRVVVVLLLFDSSAINFRSMSGEHAMVVLFFYYVPECF